MELSKLKNRFIVVEGIDGSGKTELISKLRTGLGEKFKPSLVQSVRQPGGDTVGKAVRQLLLSDIDETIPPISRLLLLQAARYETMEFIDSYVTQYPLDWVLCDRHIDSTYAYQGTEGVKSEEIDSTLSLFKNFVEPSITIYLDVDVDIALSRIRAARTALDVYDGAGLDFFQCVKVRYEERIKLDPSRFLVVDANKPAGLVFEEVFNYLLSRS